MAERLSTLIEGRVQGVGFRYATAARARALGLTGWVRNLSDGQVEAVFEGSRSALDTMLDWCHDGPAYAQVHKVKASWESATPEFETFSMRY